MGCSRIPCEKAFLEYNGANRGHSLQIKGREMLDAIALVIFLVGGSYAIYYGVRFLLGFIFERKPKNWVTQHYRKHSGVDLGKVHRVITTETPPTEEFSHAEMVAVFGLFLLQTEVSDVLRKAETYYNQGWSKRFNYDFYSEIASVAKKISAQGHKKRARELIMFGQRLAELYGEKEWITSCRKLLDEQLAEISNLEWEFTRR
jgi:hypothetical protein